MRSMLLLGLAIFTLSEASGAEIPQDLARMEKRRLDKLEWNRRTIQGAYDTIGKRDPRWDKPAREAFDLAARMFSRQVDPTVTQADVHVPARAALDAGCDDPYLVYLYHRSATGKDFPGEAEGIRRMGEAARALSSSKYPAIRRAIASELAGQYLVFAKEPSDRPKAKAEAEAFLDASLALIPESVKLDERSEFWEEQWLGNLYDLIRDYRTFGLEPEAAYKRVDEKLDGVPELEAVRLRLRGKFWYHYGWEARTNAFAGAVPAGGFERLEERLATARKAFEASWKLKPDAPTAQSLMEIDKAVGGDRAAMELWFDRAMKADGDTRDACWTKLDWLDPKWHGTPEEMLAFGRQCRETKNWRAGLTLLCADAHSRFASMLPREEFAKYLASAEVWADITSVYDEYLKHHPEDHVARSKYAALAYISHHHPEAHAQFQTLGENLTAWRESPFFPIETLKRMRDASARSAARKEGPK